MEKTKSVTQGIIPRLMRHAGKNKGWMLLSWALAAAAGVASLGPYVCIYYLVRELMQGQGALSAPPAGELSHYGWLAVQAVMFSFMLYGLALCSSHMAAFRLIGRLRIRLVRHLESLPLGFHLSHPSGALRKTVEKNCDNMENFIAHQMPDTVQAVVVPVAFLACMIWFDWKLCLICLIPIVVGFWILRSLLKGYNGHFLIEYQNAMANMSAGAVEYVRGISVVKVFGQSLYAFSRLHEAILNYKKFLTAYTLSAGRPIAVYITVINGFFFLLIPAGIIFYCSYHTPALRERFVLSFVFFMIFTPLVPLLLTRIMYSSSNKLISTQALDDIEELLAQPVMPASSAAVRPEGHDNDIAFNNVRFAYSEDTPTILEDLSFTAEKGGITALVGPSGAGKTTVVNLIARFWDVTGGSITAGGADLRDMDYSRWISGVGLVSQEPKLFAMTLADNVGFCKPGATREEIEKALSQAQCDDILAKFKDGLDTKIGVDGVHLSYGEMQRVCLARALLQDPPILLLDEIMAYADADNEYRIQQVLNLLTRDKTVVMVAHRLSTITGARKILVMDHGRIVESGTHQDLLANKGLYQKMYNEYQTASTWKLGGEHA